MESTSEKVEELAQNLTRNVLEIALKESLEVQSQEVEKPIAGIELTSDSLTPPDESKKELVQSNSKAVESSIGQEKLNEPITEKVKRSESPERKNPQEFIYYTKEIKYQDRMVKILLQNENGPCPLIAIVNVLALKGTISIDKPIIESSGLLEILANFIMEKPTKTKEDEYAKQESIEVLPLLLHGMDINPYFDRIDQFENTKQLSIFDFLSIPLVHGWIWNPKEFIDPKENPNLKSYNHLVEYLIENPNGSVF
jgi:hypothetical protein